MHMLLMQTQSYYIESVSCHYLQIWQFLLQLSCPSSVKQDWQKIVKEIVTNRVNGLSNVTRLDLFLQMELDCGPNTPSLIANILMTEATTALDELVIKKVSELLSFHVHTFSSFVLIIARTSGKCKQRWAPI